MNDNKFKAHIPQESDVRLPTSVEKLENALAVIIRNPEAYEQVYQELKSKHIARLSRYLSKVWQIVREFHKTHNQLPDGDDIVAEMCDRLSNNGNFISPEEKEKCDDFLDYAFTTEGLDSSAKKRRVAIEDIKKFLEEQLSYEVADKINEDGIPINLPELLNRVSADAERIRSISTVTLEPLFEEGWQKDNVRVCHTSGIPIIDRFLDGGPTGGEVYSFIGPSGSCKTTLGLQLTANAAKDAYVWNLLNPDKEPKTAVYISTESSKKDIRARIWSYISQVPIKRLLGENWKNTLSRSKVPGDSPETEYEKRLFLDGVGFVNEYKRAKAAIEVLNGGFQFLDCTPRNPQNREMGGRGFKDVLFLFKQLISAGRVANFMVLDHASGLAKRVADARNDPEGNTKRGVLIGLPDDLRIHIAEAYDIPVWVLHQMAPEHNNRPPTYEFHHNNAADAKNFGEYCDFSIVTGKTSKELFACFRCTKHRRTAPPVPGVVHVDGFLNRIVSVEDTWTIDPHGKAFIRRSELEEMQGNLHGSESDTYEDEEVLE